MDLRRIEPLRRRLLSHPVYAEVRDERTLHAFTRSHVFAVWDFQSLLAGLRSRLACTSVPWQPTRDREARRLVNEIALDEESGAHPEGGFASHFELYLDAMRRCGADTSPVEAFVEAVAGGQAVRDLLSDGDLPAGVADFVGTTFSILGSGRLHEAVAAFSLGREDVIPGMFRRLVERLAESSPREWGLFRHYLDLHIEHDESRHGPMARALVDRVCGGDPGREREAEAAAVRSLEARLRFWDAIADALRVRDAAA